MRLGAIFIAICMVLIAGSAGAALHFAFGFRATEALVVAIAVLTGLGLFNSLSAGLRRRATFVGQIRDLARGNADVARQVAEMGRRLAALEGRFETAFDKTRAATDPLAIEIGELGSLVKQLAETAAVHEVALNELARPEPVPMAAADTLPAEEPRAATTTRPAGPTTVVALPGAAEPEPAPATPIPEPTDARAVEERLATIRAAIDANRIDLYLQPIVTLPQRKVRYYEAMTRLRNDRGEVVQACDFIALAEGAGLMPKIDNMAVFRSIQVVRRLLLNSREVGLFCNLSESTLNDAQVFPQILEFLDANRAIAPSVVLEFTQAAIRGAGPIETESLAALAERGFRFSLDNVTDLRIEPRELSARGFRFIKIPASLLLNRSNTAATDIHPADISDLLGRFGIDLIAERIEGESAVVDLLDYDVRFGQGFLFSPPRPVRAEALQSIGERNGMAARESVGAREGAAAPDGPTTGSPRRPSDSQPVANGSEVARTAGLAQLARRV